MTMETAHLRLAKEKPKAGRREQRKAENRARLLEAAEYLFTTKGFHETSPGEIAEKADLGHGTFYSFFNDKQDCHHAVVCEKRQEMLDLLHSEVDGVDCSKDRLRKMAGIIVRAAFRAPDIVRLSICDMHLSAPNNQDESCFVDYWAPRLSQLLSVPGGHQVEPWPVGYLLAGKMVTIMALTQSRRISEAQARTLMSQNILSQMLHNETMSQRQSSS